MKYVKGILQKELPVLKGKQWYHQIFDGCPLLIHSIAHSEIRDEKKKRGCGKGIRVCFFHNHRADWYIDMEDIKRISGIIMGLGKTNPNISKELIADWKESYDTFYPKCLEIGSTDLTGLSKEELIKLFDEFKEIGYNKFSSSSIIDGFALGTDEIIANMIKEVLESKGMVDKFPELFSKLSAPVHQSFINVAEVSLLRIALIISNNEELRNFVLEHTTDEVISYLKENNPDIYLLLEKHVEDYFWSRNNYVMAYNLNMNFFLKEIKETLENGHDINEEIRKITTTPEVNRKVKEELVKGLRLDPYLVTLLTISEDFTYWQDERKKATYWNAHYMLMLVKEIGKRFGFTLDEMKYMSHPEVSSLLVDLPTKQDMQDRIKLCAEYWSDNGVEIITYNNNIEDLKLLILGMQDYSHIKEFNGLCASVGKVVGKVKVCRSATEVGKVQKGEILVAIMTRPDYVVGMKKAAAIVTNEGGITSHAAIVSRELGIPCVIGTKFATKVLNDGDLIEVDADRGIVKVLDRA